MAGRTSRVSADRRLGFALAGGVIGLLIVAVVLIMRSQRNDTLVLEVGSAPDPNQIRVYVGGGVSNPGLYTLARGSRVADAIDAAGGLAPGADTAELGMAAVLEDTDQVIVAVAAPTPAALANTTEALAFPTAVAPPAGGAGPIHINSASAAELETLPGIGPALAERIVEYRGEHGPFQSLEELEAVRGISLAMVEELRPLIALGP